MHVLQVSFFVDPQGRAPATLLREWHALADVAVSAASACGRVTVIQASRVPGEITRSGVTFHFVPPAGPRAPLTRSATFQVLLRDLAPDVIHVHGLGFAREVLGLRRLLPRTPILLQDHADRVPRFYMRGAARRAIGAASGISFCASAQAEPFRRAGMIGSGARVFEIPESTSDFMPGDPAAARAATGLHGDPAVLWVGHLDPNKDPLTVLDGVSATARDLPGLRLWCCYSTAPLLAKVQARIDGDATLRGRVHLLGSVPHEQVELLMRAADLFVLGSHREGGSFALIEALATGLTPVVTDIPSSRALTGDGRVGALWPCGDSHMLGESLRVATATLRPRSRAEVRAHFDTNLSSAAIGRKLRAAYLQLSDERSVVPDRLCES